MGVENVQAALAISHTIRAVRDLRILLHMAMRSLDKPNGKGQQPYLYYGGEDELLVAAYGPRAEYPRSCRTNVQESMKRLRDAGLIEPLNQARRGTRQTWRQTYATSVAMADSPPGSGTGAPPVQVQIAPPVQVQNVPKPGAPRRDQEEGQESSARTSPVDQEPSRTYAGADVASESDVDGVERGHAFAGRPDDSCLTCGGAYQNRKLHPLYLLTVTA
jgi:hypothetical protein